jgi:hypothetical protein
MYTTRGDTVRVASPTIFAKSMYEVYCCHDETLTFLDGKVSQAAIRPSTACPDANWRLRGKAAHKVMYQNLLLFRIQLKGW